MKVFSFICAVICTTMVVITCSLVSNSPVAIRGNEKTITVTGEKTMKEYTVILENLRFLNSLENASVNIVSIPTTQEARVEATYSEDLDNYNFSIDIVNNTITLSMDTKITHPIKTFDIAIYANVGQVQATGSGYKLFVDSTFRKTSELYISGEITTNVMLGDNNDFVLASAGSSIADVTGRVNNAKIAISGSSVVYAETLVCEDATVSISGNGKAQLSIKYDLDVELNGHSTFEYWGKPIIKKQEMEANSTLIQLGETVKSSEFML